MAQRLPTPLRHARIWLVLLLAVAGCGLVMAAGHDGYPALVINQGIGSVWVASIGPGQLALLDGASAKITTRVRVANDGHDILALTGPDAGYAVDRTAGQLVRVSDATWQTSDAYNLIAGTTSGLRATIGDRALFATDVDRGLVVRANPDSLQPDGPPLSLPAAPASSPVLDHRGDLWVLDGGILVRMGQTPETVQTGLAAGDDARVVVADGHPVVADLSAGNATPVDDAGNVGDSACIDIDPADRTVRILGDDTWDRLYVLSGSSGTLHATDLDTGDCETTIPDIAAPGSDLGDPVQSGRSLFVPDFSTGQVIVIDLDRRTHVSTTPVTDPGSVFDLLSRDGFAFYNVPADNNAGVIGRDGAVAPVVKYDLEDPEKGVFHPSPTSRPTVETASDGPTAGTHPAESDDGGSAAGPATTPTSDASSTGPASTSRSTSTTTSSSSTPPSPVAGEPPTSAQTDDTEGGGPTSAAGLSADPSSSDTVPTRQVPVITDVMIDSKHGPPFLHGDMLTFSAVTSGGDPSEWLWTLEDLTHGAGRATQVSTKRSFAMAANSAGQATEWRITLVASNGDGPSDPVSKDFTVAHTNDNPVVITDFHASGQATTNNIGLAGQPITFVVATTGAPFSCEVSVTDSGTGASAGVTECNHALTFPAGTYHASATATPREGDPDTAAIDLIVYSDSVLTVTFAGAGSGTVGDGVRQPCTASCSVPYQLGERTTLLATPESGGGASWSGCEADAGNNCTITMLGPKQVTVNWIPPFKFVSTCWGDGTQPLKLIAQFTAPDLSKLTVTFDVLGERPLPMTRVPDSGSWYVAGADSNHNGNQQWRVRAVDDTGATRTSDWTRFVDWDVEPHECSNGSADR